MTLFVNPVQISMNVPRAMVDVNRSVPTLLAPSFAVVTKDSHLMPMGCLVMVSY